MNVESLVEILKASVAPYVLISVIGLLLLSMAQRMGRPIDRIRIFCRELNETAGAKATQIEKQITLLYNGISEIEADIEDAPYFTIEFAWKV